MKYLGVVFSEKPVPQIFSNSFRKFNSQVNNILSITCKTPPQLCILHHSGENVLSPGEGVSGLVGNVLTFNARCPGSSLACAQGNQFSDGQ